MITIDDPEVERQLRDAAQEAGATVAELVREAVRAHVVRPAAAAGEAPPEEQARREAAILRIQQEFAALPVYDARSADEILGYDENGLPT